MDGDGSCPRRGRGRRWRGRWHADARARSAAGCSNSGGGFPCSPFWSGSSIAGGSSLLHTLDSLALLLFGCRSGSSIVAGIPQCVVRALPARLPARPLRLDRTSVAWRGHLRCPGPSGCSRRSRSSSAASGSVSTPSWGGVIDVGYAGVIGADLYFIHGQAPYGHTPVEDGPTAVVWPTATARSDRIQENGRCESANARGDTYGPLPTSRTSRPYCGGCTG